MNNRLFVLLPILAMVVLTTGAISPTFAQVSVGGTVGVGTTATTATTTPPVVRHFHDFHHHGFLGLGLGLGLNAGLNTGGAIITGTTIPGFTTFRDFAHAHNEHFVLLNNRFVLLPNTVACPAGTVLQSETGECAILQGQETVVQQEAPTILQEQVQAPASIVTTESAAVPATATETTQTETTQTQTEQPIVSCPAGATLDPNTNTCSTTVTVQQQQQQNVQPIITCPTGSSLQGGQCIEQEQQITVNPLPCPTCPPGSGLVNGQCVVSALPSQVTVGSTPGQIIVLGHTFEHHGVLPFLHFRH